MNKVSGILKKAWEETEVWGMTTVDPPDQQVWQSAPKGQIGSTSQGSCHKMWMMANIV